MKKQDWELQSENTQLLKNKRTKQKRRKLEESKTKEQEIKRGWRGKTKVITRQTGFFLVSTGPAFWSPLNSCSIFY